MTTEIATLMVSPLGAEPVEKGAAGDDDKAP